MKYEVYNCTWAFVSLEKCGHDRSIYRFDLEGSEWRVAAHVVADNTPFPHTVFH